ncbi:MAG: hypothetical protein JSV77_07345 [Dehalococcoidales bacterium]|nr:MAG: hypothetical protein JSV77_07345 [Dehalococcoidales bacterium]
MRFRLVLGAIALSLSVFGLVHHWYLTGRWFSWEQFWHHEPLIAIALCVGIALMTTAFLGGRGVRVPR